MGGYTLKLAIQLPLRLISNLEEMNVDMQKKIGPKNKAKMKKNKRK